jgi:hypothetical protein
VRIVAWTISIAMLLALAFVFWKRRRPRATAAAPVAGRDPVEALVSELARMDVDFERRGAVSDAERAEFADRRAALKARLNAALAARNGPA